MINLEVMDAACRRHTRRVTPYIMKRARSILDGKIGTPANPVVLSPGIRKLLESFLDEGEVRHIIGARPGEFRGIIEYIQDNHYAEATRETDSSVLYNLFISSVYDKTDRFSKLDFIKDINLDTCLYCNRGYIYYLSGVDGTDIKPEIDHFYPKAKYPFLGLSFYNLIPSCQICNGGDAKGSKDPNDEDLVNPYELDDENFKFTYKISKIDVLRPLASKYNVEVKLRSRLEGNNRVFKLERLYQQHSDHVLELIIKSQCKYPTVVRDYLKSYKGLAFDNHEIDRIIVGNYTRPEDVGKRPLAKMYQDIARELKLLS